MPAMMTWRRDSISQTVEGVPHTFSSWNNCMSKAYCKWPAIVGIIIASLLVISILWCLARCLCCGMSCCCSCFSCCDSCCPSGSRRSNRNNPADPQPSMFHPAPYQGYQPAPPPPSYEPPQFARFDAHKNGKVNEDALPAMPSWETASERKIPQAEQRADEDMEMGRLDPLHAQQAPMLAARNGAPSPRAGYAEMDSSPYRQHGAYDGGDLGSPYGRQESGVVYGGAYPQQYGRQQRPQQQQPQQAYGRGYSGQSGYEAYMPSESTAFEPSSVGRRGDAGVYSPASPAAGRQYAAGQPPNGLQVGRKAVANSWRDV